MSLLHTFIYLLAGHALADFPLQGDFLAIHKNRNVQLSDKKLWAFALTYHAIIHGAFVLLITQSILLFTLEVASHWTIDFLKCDNKLTFAQDQFLHIGCKILWVVILACWI